jgi:hypothetical protein
MAGKGTIFTLTFMLAMRTCQRSRHINGTAQLLDLIKGVRYKDGAPIAG